jgi:hypothetical protein
MEPVNPLEHWIALLRAARRAAPRGFVGAREVDAAVAATNAYPDSVDLWLLRGDFVQLCDDGDAPFPLEDALASYERAAALDPTRPEPHVEIGHFHDAVRDDPASAVPHFERAIALGAGDAVARALAAVRAQLGG